MDRRLLRRQAGSQRRECRAEARSAGARAGGAGLRAPAGREFPAEGADGRRRALSRRGDGGRSALHGARSIHAEAVRQPRNSVGHQAGRGGHRRDRRRGAGHARVPEHLGSDARSRTRTTRCRCASSAAACAACSSARARAGRRSCASWRRRRTSVPATSSTHRAWTAPIRLGWRSPQVDTVERDTGQMFAHITCSPLSGVDRSQFLLVLGQAAALPPRPEEPGDADATKKGGRGKGRRGG